MSQCPTLCRNVIFFDAKPPSEFHKVPKICDNRPFILLMHMPTPFYLVPVPHISILSIPYSEKYNWSALDPNKVISKLDIGRALPRTEFFLKIRPDKKPGRPLRPYVRGVAPSPSPPSRLSPSLGLSRKDGNDPKRIDHDQFTWSGHIDSYVIIFIPNIT